MELCSTPRPVQSQQSSEGEWGWLWKAEKQCKRQVWEGCGSPPRRPRVHVSQPSYTAVPWEAKPRPTETNLLKYTQGICSHTHTHPPCSFHQGQQHLQLLALSLLLSGHSSAGREICQQALACLDRAWQADSPHSPEKRHTLPHLCITVLGTCVLTATWSRGQGNISHTLSGQCSKGKCFRLWIF